MQLYILGAGEFSHCVSELAKANGKYDAVYLLDDNTSKENVHAPISEAVRFINPNSEFVVAIGNDAVRMRLLRDLKTANATLAVLVHPRAYVSPSARMGGGTIVMPMAIINSNTSVGDGCIVDCGAVVDHNCALGNGIHVRPGAIIRPRTVVPDGAIVSAGDVVDMKW